MISFSAYAIIAIGKMIKLNSLVTQQKASEVASPRLFYSVLARVAYSPGWLPATIFYPAICKCSRRLHLPQQREKKIEIDPLEHTPFLYLSGGGSASSISQKPAMEQRCSMAGFSFIPPLQNRWLAQSCLSDTIGFPAVWVCLSPFFDNFRLFGSATTRNIFTNFSFNSSHSSCHL